jgi:hypothetical protein
MSPEQKRLYYGYLVVAVIVVVGMVVINWIDTGCNPGNC